MLQLTKELSLAQECCSQLKEELSKCDCPETTINEYIDMKSRIHTAPQKTKKKLIKEIKILSELHKNIENDKNIVLNQSEQRKHFIL